MTVNNTILHKIVEYFTPKKNRVEHLKKDDRTCTDSKIIELHKLRKSPAIENIGDLLSEEPDWYHE